MSRPFRYMKVWPKTRPAGPHYAPAPCIAQRYYTRTHKFTTFCTKQTAPSLVLVLDATNIFFHAKADLQRWEFALKKTERYRHKFISSQFNAYVDYYCSIVGTTNVIAVFDPYSSSSQGSKNKQPRRKTTLLDTIIEEKQLNQNLNSLVVMSSSATADCAIADTCALLSEELLPAAKVVVATADTDLLQVCNPNTSILHIHPYPTKSHPYSVELVTNDKFEMQYGFAPSVWGEYEALGGSGGGDNGSRKKKEKGIKGVGVSRNSARKLLQQFGSLKGIERAGEKGTLKGWGSPVQLLFNGNSDDSEKARSVLQQNLEKTVLRGESKAALSDKDKQSIHKYALNIEPSTIATIQHIDIWKHPLHSARWNMLSAHQLTETLTKQLQVLDPGAFIDIKCTTTLHNNAVDMIITRDSNSQGETSGESSNNNKKKTIGVMICTYADFKDEHAAKEANTTWKSIIETSISTENGNNNINTNKWFLEGTDESIAESTRKLKRYLNTWASIHLSLLEQDDSLSVMACVPYTAL